MASQHGVQVRKRLVESLQKIYEEAWGRPDLDQVAVILSGGVDTCAVVEGLHELGIMPKTALTVYAHKDATDRAYAPLIAKKFGLEKHVEIQVSPDELLEEPLAFCVKELGTFDGMELRNSCVVARALLEANKLGNIKYLFTGDGSDELMGGYSFTHQSEDPLWSQKRDDMCKRWFFSAPVMGKALGLEVSSPYTHDHFKIWAMENLNKQACIGERPLESKPGETRTNHVTGKIPLREAYPEATSAWRRKDPIEVGSGSTILGKNNGEYFESKIDSSQFLKEKQEILQKHKIVIRNAEHLFYFRKFQTVFPDILNQPHPAPISAMVPARPLDASNPDECIGCRFLLPFPDSNFCKVCGAWPARKQSTATALNI